MANPTLPTREYAAVEATIPRIEDITDTELAWMPIDVVNRRLRDLDLSAEPLVKNVVRQASPIKAIVEGARASQLERGVMVRRLWILGILQFTALFGGLATVWALIAGYVVSEKAMVFSGVLTIGFSGVLLGSLWAFAHLLLSQAYYDRIQVQALEAQRAELLEVIREVQIATPPSVSSALDDVLIGHPKIRDLLASLGILVRA